MSVLVVAVYCQSAEVQRDQFCQQLQPEILASFTVSLDAFSTIFRSSSEMNKQPSAVSYTSKSGRIVHVSHKYVWLLQGTDYSHSMSVLVVAACCQSADIIEYNKQAACCSYKRKSGPIVDVSHEYVWRLHGTDYSYSISLLVVAARCQSAVVQRNQFCYQLQPEILASFNVSLDAFPLSLDHRVQ
ncbi:hypothetical protein WA026_003881 [Henosepilachna vigintioctopunctata]|uniref:Uncharacterized protein n=1 Tax=Henosepilachna vigintioctopunctata TaxID=420089 RepID=A0AAW1UF20_9CUCU